MEKMNTTETIKKTSSVLDGKCKKTQDNLQKLMADALCPQDKVTETMLPIIPGSKDDVVFAGLNGVSFYFKRGERVKMPEAIRKILHNADEL